MDFNNIIYHIAIVALPLMLAVSAHEAAHGYMAGRLGDPTARLLGRVTLNPLHHIDPFGTIIFPLILILSNTGIVFGYAKPVPVNYLNLRDPKKGMVRISLAGPVSNLLLAFVSGFLLRTLLVVKPELSFLSQAGGSILAQEGWTAAVLVPLYLMLEYSVLINSLLALFNLVPIPPLDGGHVLMGLLPEGPAGLLRKVEPFGFIIVLAVIIFDPFGIWSLWISAAMYGLFHLFLMG